MVIRKNKIKARKLLRYCRRLTLVFFALLATASMNIYADKNIRVALNEHASNDMHAADLEGIYRAFNAQNHEQALTLIARKHQQLQLTMKSQVAEEYRQQLASFLVAALEVYRGLGYYDRARTLLERNQVLADKLPATLLSAKLLYQFGVSYYAFGELDRAKYSLISAQNLLESIEDCNSLKASLAYHLGLVRVADNDLRMALSDFKSAYNNAARAGDVFMQAQTRLSMSKTQLTMDALARKSRTKSTASPVPAGAFGHAKNHLSTSLAIFERLDNEQQRKITESQWIALGKLFLDASLQFSHDKYRLMAFTIFQKVQTRALASENFIQQSYALGYIGRAYELEDAIDEALHHTRQALFIAQAQSWDRGAYVWQWQMARLLKSAARIDQSLSYYRQATGTLNRMDTWLELAHGVDFHREVSPVYYGLADILLAISATEENADKKQSMLQEVLDVLESVKVAEVENYLQSQCVVLSEKQVALLEIAGKHALVYPVLLADRIEIIVKFPSHVAQYTVNDVSAGDVRDLSQSLRRSLEDPYSQQNYLILATQLYRWLIDPIKAVANEQGVETLVFVPDGPLRTVPMAVLHSGEKFLIEEFALSVTPGMRLVEPKPFSADKARVLATGLTLGVRGYSPLPGVDNELNSISKIFPTSRFQDQGYESEKINSEMTYGKYSIVHFATHAEFSGDHSQSFLLTYDGRLTLDNIGHNIRSRRFTDGPIDLLVLSACETALGDEKAALGLASAALDAGARSALATLWQVDDAATADLIAEFYRQLRRPGTGKARALQLAQIKILTQDAYAHPKYWAPFLMIGSWL